MRKQFLFAAASFLYACGGGGSSSGPAAPPPDPPPTSIAVLDATPASQATSVDPELGHAFVAHTGFDDFVFTDTGDCAASSAVRRTPLDLSDANSEVLFDHRMACSNLGATSAVEIQLSVIRDDGSEFVLDHSFSTGSGAASDLNVLDSVGVTQAEVGTVFADYVASQLLAQLDLPLSAQLLIAASVLDLRTGWTQLQNPAPVYNVVAQRVSYRSSDPFGDASDLATGLVVWPDTAGGFVPRDRVVVLQHATGSTPSELDLTNAWYLTGLILASRGYLVIAPDNWGRGGTSQDPETYLMANRTAVNSVDMISQVLNHPDYQPYIADPMAAELAIVGYSQGGHSALATWHALTTHAYPAINVAEVFAGAGPYDLYRTYRGVVEFVAGICGGDAYCRFVDAETTVPFATDRIMPGLLAYTVTGLSAADVIDGDTLADPFVADFLSDAPRLDALKGLLQLSSFSNITNADEIYSGSNTVFNLYHSDFDRLVPVANNDALVSVLSPQHTINTRSELCNTTTYESIFNTIDKVGVVHALCGFAMIDDVLVELD